MPKKELEIRDLLLFIIAITLIINTFLSLRLRKAEADTFKTDDCITYKITDKPSAYLHVVSHQI